MERRLTPPDLETWIAWNDTPDRQQLAEMERSRTRVPPVHVLLRGGSEALLAASLAALSAAVGVRWTCRVAAAAPGTGSSRAHGLVAGHAAEVPADAVHVALEAGTLPRPHALRLLVDALAQRPGTRLAFGDEMTTGPDGRLCDPWFKPRFSPCLVAAGAQLGGLFAAERELVEAWLEAGEAGLRGVPPERTLHLPHVLAMRTGPVSAPMDPSIAGGAVMPGDEPPERADGCVDPLPLVSILVPTRDHWELLAACLDAIARSDWPAGRREVIVIDNGSRDPETLAGLAAAEAGGHIRVIRDDGAFNFARLNNRAAMVARGEVLILLNNDAEAIAANWITRLVRHACLPGVGAVGPRLLYPDGSIQHAGLVLGVRGMGLHAHLGLPAGAPGYHGLAALTHEVSAVTAACLAVRRESYLAVGGMDEALAVSCNDVALCLALQAHGLSNRYLAESLVVHHESHSRGADQSSVQRAVAIREATHAWQRFRDALAEDQWYSPCLSLDDPYVPAPAPRRRAAWTDCAQAPLVALLLPGLPGVATRLARRQYRALHAAGYRVLVLGALPPAPWRWRGARCLWAPSARAAATLVLRHQADALVVHGAPFLPVARWTGLALATLVYDHAGLRSRAPERAVDPLLERELHELAMYSGCLAPDQLSGDGVGGVTEVLAAFYAVRPTAEPVPFSDSRRRQPK